MRNNIPQRYRPPNSPSPVRWLLLIGAIALVVGVSVFSVFYFGVFNSGHGGNSGTPTISTGNGSPVTGGGPCTIGSPYGFTTINADSQLVAVYKQLNTCWVRYQVHWAKIETSPGAYDWSQVDAAVQLMNQSHIYVDFAIESAPSWERSLICVPDGKNYLPGPNEMAHFATLLATRYNGKHGHGHIDSFEIGNEEYDQHFTGSMATSELCRQASTYGPVLKAGYMAIKAVYPTATVGMFGQWLHNIDHIRTFMNDLYTGGYGNYLDYMNFHFYNGGQDPSVSHGSIPSFNMWWQTMHEIAAQHGFANKPIWVTEVGWPTHTPKYNPNKPVALQVQAQYLQYVMDQARQSGGVIQKVFWFTIDYGNQADNIYPPSGPLPAFTNFQQIVQQNPVWTH
jgi:hypothetical protein